MIRPLIAVAVLALFGSVPVLVPGVHAEPPAVESAPTQTSAASESVDSSVEASGSAAKNQRTAVEPSGTARRPPGGLWGETLQDGNDKGIRKATGGAYNYKHIGMAIGIVVLVILGLIVLVRRHSGSPREPGQ